MSLEEIASANSDNSESIVSRAEELARANGCILRMAELERDVVMLSLLDELPNAHVAAQLGISEGYVRVLLHRARSHVRNCPDQSSVRPSASGAVQRMILRESNGEVDSIKRDNLGEGQRSESRSAV